MIRIISCGKVRQKWMADGIDEYVKRIKAYDKIEIVEVPDEKAPESNSEADNEIVKNKEGEKILKQIRDDDFVILLDLEGKLWTSPEMAQYLSDLYTYGKNRIDFVIGGSLGVSEAVRKRSNYRWKISNNTFPHQLCRVIVAEQIYRSFRIIHNEPYHK